MLGYLLLLLIISSTSANTASATATARTFSNSHQHHSPLEALTLPIKQLPQNRHGDEAGNSHLDSMLQDSLVTLVVDRNTITDVKDAWMQVSWSGLTFPKVEAWIGLFPCSDDACEDAFFGVAPVSFKYAAAQPHLKPASSGTLRFWIALRPGVSRFRFAFVSSSDPFPILLARSGVVEFTQALANSPQHIRLSLASTSVASHTTPEAVKTRTDNTAMRVMWAQREVLCDIAPQVRYALKGAQPGGIRGVFGGRRRVSRAVRAYGIKREWMCDQDVSAAGKQGWINQPVQLEAIMHGLLPGKTYVYTVGDDIHGWTPDRFFKAPPASHEGYNNERSNAKTIINKSTNQEASQDIGQSTNHISNPVFSISVFGDMGQSMNEIDGSQQHSWDFDNRGEMPAPNTTRLLEALVNKDKTSLVFHFGDISYAVGYESEWDNFLQQIEKVSAFVPWMTGIGNHEQGYSGSFVKGSDSGGECGFAYLARFPFASSPLMPTHLQSLTGDLNGRVKDNINNRLSEEKRVNTLDDTDDCVVESDAQYTWASEARKNRPWYSFQHSMAHITVMSTEHPFAPGTPQYQWLKHDLLHNVDRTRTPWLIFSGHRPIYIDSANPVDTGFGHDIAESIEPLLIEAKVELGLWGHHHSYQRTCHVSKFSCDGEEKQVKGPVHLVVGTAGYSASPVPDPSTSEIFMHTSGKHWGVVQLNFYNSTHLQTTFIDNEEGRTLDESWIVRQDDIDSSSSSSSSSFDTSTSSVE